MYVYIFCMYIYVCVYICIYLYIFVSIYVLFIKACPITLGNTTCRINLLVHQEASFVVSFYIVHIFYDARFIIIYVYLYMYLYMYLCVFLCVYVCMK